MRRFPLFLLIPLLLFSSCAQEEFTVSSLSLRSRIDVAVEGGEAMIDESLVLSAAPSDPEEGYTFRLSSPDGSLWWEGSLSGSDILTSVPLELTPGAYFPEGDYSVLFYSTNGTELERSVSYHAERAYPSFIDGRLSSPAYVSEFLEDGTVAAEGEREEGYEAAADAVRAVMTVTDRYGNSISVSQSFLP